MDITGAISKQIKYAPTVIRSNQDHYLIMRLKCSWKHTQEMKRGKPKITTGTSELIATTHSTTKEIEQKIANQEGLKHLVEVLDLEVLSEHGYTVWGGESQAITGQQSSGSECIGYSDGETREGIQPRGDGSSDTGFALLDYQERKVDEGLRAIDAYGISYMALEMRLGKSHISLEIAKRKGARNVLFLTPKAAIGSVEQDYKDAGHNFRITVTNYEQLKGRFEEFQVENFDLFIFDEAHKIGGQFPTPSNKAKMLRQLCSSGQNIIFLSGTPTPESFSQIYHTLYVTPHSPFAQYKNFYHWAKDYVDVYQIPIRGRRTNQYNRAKADLIMEKISPFFVTFTQEEAGFNHKVEDQIHEIRMEDKTYNLLKLLKRDKVVRFKDGGRIIADTPSKYVNLVHQISSGTVKYEAGDGTEARKCFDHSKIYEAERLIDTIRSDAGSDAPIAIFYNFIAEGQALREYFGDRCTDSLERFQLGESNLLIVQVRTVREGVNISSARGIIFYNLGFSFADYTQARQRHQARDRDTAPIAHFIFSSPLDGRKRSIERQVYNRLKDKKKFTAAYYND